MIRLTDDDKNWGPFTLGKGTERRFNFTYIAGVDEDNDNEKYNTLTIQTWGLWILRIRLPYIVKALELKTYPKWDEETIARLKRDYYTTYFSREYGISTYDGHLFLQYGPQKGVKCEDRFEDCSKCIEIPWVNYRQTKFQIRTTGGVIHWEQPNDKLLKNTTIFEQIRLAKRSCPKPVYTLLDYDGTLVRASVVVYYREYRLGINWFKWLGYIIPKRIYRSLNVVYTEEVGKKKESWKGGTLECTYPMLKNETAYDAFVRLCQEENLRIVE